MLNRAAERDKYIHVYDALPDYKMGGARMADAREDLDYFRNQGAQSYLDIGCGRGEMLRYARSIGFEHVCGTEIVPELCSEGVQRLAIHELDSIPDDSFDAVSSFDVIEHVLPGDDEALVAALGRIASNYLVLTANNRPSIDPTTGNDLHINIRTYNEWHDLISGILRPEWKIVRVANKRYVSATWRAYR